MYRDVYYVGYCAALCLVLAGCQRQNRDAARNAETPTQVAPRTETPPENTGVDPSDQQQKKVSACAEKFYPKFEDDPATAKIFAALAQPTTIDFAEVALRDVMGDLERQHHIAIQLDNRALDEASIETDTPMTFRLNRVTLHSTLRVMLRDLDLTYIIKDEVLLITTPEVAENHLETRMYDVRELAPARLDDEDRLDLDAVVELIESIAAPTTWDAVGGPGHIDSYDGILVIRQEQPVLALASRLLTQFCRLKNGEIEPGTMSISVTEVSIDLSVDSPAAARNVTAIRSALESDTRLDFSETPLREAVAVLAKAHGINIVIDNKALDEAGIESETPVTRQLSGITLRSALALMLRDMDLTYVVKDEVLWITTPEVTENHLVTRLYPVGDLVETIELSLTQKLLQASDKPQPDYDALRNVILATTSTTSWDEVGGPGAVFIYEPAECLVINAAEEVHAEVEYLFAQLRDTLGRRPATPLRLAAPIPPDRVMTLVYSIGPAPPIRVVGGLFVVPDVEDKKPGADATPKKKEALIVQSNALAEKIKKHIAPESWRDKRFSIDAMPRRLVIRQTYAVHKQIARFLEHSKQLARPWYTGEDVIQNAADPAQIEKPPRPRGGSYYFGGGFDH